METAIFPQANDRQVDARTAQRMEAAQKRSSERVCEIEKQRPTKQPKLLEMISDILSGGMSLFCTLGVVVCFCDICTMEKPSWERIVAMLFAPLLLPILTFPIVLIIGFIVCCIAKISYKKQMQEYSNEHTVIIAQEGQTLQEEIAKIQHNGENEKKIYRENFEKNAQEISERFANSQLIKEIVNWMMTGLSRQINVADRSSHIKKISVPFEFTVCENAVLCSLGSYDFQEKRCRPLHQPLEQAGLARALAADLQIAILMKYPKDISGTKIRLRVDQTYRFGEGDKSVYGRRYNTADCPKVTIYYTADNGNYKSEREW